ncbi:hypothetical protein [Streptomyces sp. NPDC047928]|uniref:hypothetical protein n=1 Tax=unclassified Streptomyces TaxID=2593676 RepID=UPI0037136652
MSSTEPTDDTPRRRRPRLAVAAMAAAVLLAGGGGTYLALAAAEGDGSGGERDAASASRGAPPPLALDGHTGGPGDDGTGPGPGIAPGEPDPGGAVYRAEGDLPDGPDAAPVYRPAGHVGSVEVSRLAKALGVTGSPRLERGTWRIGPDKDGSGGLVFHVERQAPGMWTFGLRSGTGDNCVKGKAECPSSTGTAGSPVSDDVAEKAAAPVLKALGQETAKLDTTQVTGAVRVVNADPVIGGLPTHGWSTGIQVGPDGEIVGGSGRLKAPVRGADYPVVGADEALKLLNDSVGHTRPSIGGCATPAPVDGAARQDGDGATASEGTDPNAPCDPVTGPASPEKQVVTIRKAVFGLAAQLEKGAPALVPSWLFEAVPQGGAPYTFSYPAVAPEHLAPEPKRPSEGTAMTVEQYEADGRQLKVWFTGGVCSRYLVRAEENAREVRVTVYETLIDSDRVCAAVAVSLNDTVTLDAPLGDRKVVDAQSGGQVPAKR